VRNSLAARTLISTPRAGPSLTKASIERTTPLICGSQASVMIRMRGNGNAGNGLREIPRGFGDQLAGSPPPWRRHSIVQQLFHRLRLAYAMRPCDFREEFGSVHLASSSMRRPARCCFFTGGNY
jgi:hypothetical protein